MFHVLRLPLLKDRSRKAARGAVMRQFCAAVVVGVAGQPVLAENAPYVPYSGIIRGIEGAVAVPLTIRNQTDAVLQCQAALAHWYSVDLGSAVVGGAVEVTLWHDPATGRLNILNPSQDRMPVEAIRCGKVPKVYDTQGRVALPFVIGTTPEVLHRTCAEGAADHVACTDDN